MAAPYDPAPVPDRLVRFRDLLADLDLVAPALWSDAPSYALAPPLSPEELAAAENRLGARLPAQYRQFLLVVGSAGAGPDYGLAGPAGWAMDDELPQVTATVTTVDGATVTAGTGRRPALSAQPDPARPFPLQQAWHVDEPLPVAEGSHLYDGCVRLTDIGCGYSTFLVVTGPQRGIVWVDYSAGDGDVAPVDDFLDWYGRWLDATATSLLSTAVADALDAGQPGPYERFILRWAECFERRAAVGGSVALADLAALRLYQSMAEPARAEQAHAIIEQLDGDSTVDGSVERLARWADAAGAAAAQADPPSPEAALRSSWRTRRLLAGNPQCPPDVLAALVADTRHEVRLAVAAHPACPPAALAELARDAEQRWSPVTRRECLLELDQVARHPAAAMSTVAGLAVLDERVDDELASNVVRTVAQRPGLPDPLPGALLRSRWPWVRAAAAANPATPVDIAAGLGADEHAAVRSAVAGRPDAPGDLLRRLAADPTVAVRAAVAGNPGAPVAALRQLGRDTSADAAITYALARNPSSPAQVREALRWHPYVLMSDPDDPLPAPDPGSRALAVLLAEGEVADPDYPHALLSAAIAAPEPMVGYRAGSSPWLDEPLLRQLAEHPYAYARLFAGEHPATPAPVLLALAEDPVPMVVRSVARRAELPAHVAVRLAEHEEDECRWGAALNPKLPVEVLERLAVDPSAYVRRAVLENPGTPLSTVEHLLADPEVLVRRVAGCRDDLTDAMVAALLADPEPDVVKTAHWFLARRALAR